MKRRLSLHNVMAWDDSHGGSSYCRDVSNMVDEITRNGLYNLQFNKDWIVYGLDEAITYLERYCKSHELNRVAEITALRTKAAEIRAKVFG